MSNFAEMLILPPRFDLFGRHRLGRAWWRLGLGERGQMVPEFEATMNARQLATTSAFQSKYGWHILQVEDMCEQDVSDTVRRNMAREVLYQRLAPRLKKIGCKNPEPARMCRFLSKSLQT